MPNPGSPLGTVSKIRRHSAREDALLSDFVDSMLPVIKPCVLITCAVGLVLLVGPQSADDASASVVADSHHGGRAAAALLAHARTASGNASCATDANASSQRGCAKRATTSHGSSARSCESCDVTARLVREFDAGPANPLMAAGRANSSQLQCPGLAGALGTRVSRRALVNHDRAVKGAQRSSLSASGGAPGHAPTAGGWLEACGLQHRGSSQWASRASLRGQPPLVFVYDFLDELHEELLAAPSSRSFFDAWHPHNQFLSEFTFHRSLLASGLTTSDPHLASFFFVPLYARLATLHRPLQKRLLAKLRLGLHASPFWRRSAGRDHVYVVSSLKPVATLFHEAWPLLAPSILLKVELADERRAHRRQPNHVALPYYVPWLPRDDARRLARRRFSVCLEATTLSGRAGRTRTAVAHALRRYPDANVRLVEPKRETRSTRCGARRRMRECRFCVVLAGTTPSSRRLYEAIATKCVPVVLADRIVLPYEGDANAASARAGGGGGLLPPHAYDSFMLRVPEADAPRLPQLLDAVMPRHEAMARALLAYRTAFLYELPLSGQPPAGGAVCAILADVARRFQPHLHAWRKNMSEDGVVEEA